MGKARGEKGAKRERKSPQKRRRMPLNPAEKADTLRLHFQHHQFQGIGPRITRYEDTLVHHSGNPR